jgi:DNA polymerase-3 subunit alpha
MPHAPFVHLRVRSSYSLLEGAIDTKALAARAAALDMPAVAVTDHANLFGVMPFCADALAQGVQPIVGALLPLALPRPTAGLAGLRRERVPRPGERAQRPALLPVLAQNDAGYRNLMKLMSAVYLVEPDETSVTVEDLERHNDGLILLTGGAEGPLGRLLQQGDREGAAALLDRLAAAYAGRLYVELQRHGLEAEALTEPTFLDLAFDRGLPIVATNDCLFLDAAMHEAHDALVCIAAGENMANEDRRRFSLDYRFKTAAEMAELFADLPEAVESTLLIARRCGVVAPARDPILPPFDTGAGRGEAEELRLQARAGLAQRLTALEIAGDAAIPYRERLDYELDVIVQMQFPGYFLIVSDFIKWAKQHDIPVGPGRGSGAGSVVAWSLEITDLDPLRFGLLFERFLNPERVSMPDFDIDFCQDRRDEVIRYVEDRYGHDRVAHIITFGKLLARAALRDVGRVLGLPFGLVDKICKLVPNNPAKPVTLAQAIEMEPRLKEARDGDPAVARMIEIALKLEGLPRHASTHAAGVVIGDRPLDELVPLYRDPRSGSAVTQLNMKDVEKAGLVKFDFLGLTTLTMLRLAEDLVKARGTDLDLASLPLDDAASYALMSRAETSGIFQLESGGMRDALRKLKPDCFEDIIAMVSLYRPGPMDNIPRYINVKHKVEEPAYLHPLLEPILKETNGVIIYQEQVMEIAKQLAGYSLGGADLLRRAMGKKIKAEMDAQREVFVKGATARGIEEGLANTIFDAVAKFAEYGFNKSHAAAYALLAYHTAYLKANHPLEFYAAVMTMEMANQEKLAAYRHEMRGRGIPLLPPDVNASMPIFSVEDRPGEPAAAGVRFALAAIKGVGRAAMAALVAERDARGPFKSLCDLTSRMAGKGFNRRLLEALVKAGALDSVEPNRARTMASLDAAIAYATAVKAAEDSAQTGLFGAGGETVPEPRPVDAPEWDASERLAHEFAVLGVYLSAHPLDGYAGSLEALGVLPAAQVFASPERFNGQMVELAGVVVARKEKRTERSRFAFVQLSDASAQYEVMLFADALEQSREVLEIGSIVVLTADIRTDGDEVKLSGQRLRPLDGASDRLDRLVDIVIDEPAAAIRLKPHLVEGGNGADVRLVLRLPDRREVVVALPEAISLSYAKRPAVERLAGVVGIHEHPRRPAASAL